jgi:hypothetical protein
VLRIAPLCQQAFRPAGLRRSVPRMKPSPARGNNLMPYASCVRSLNEAFISSDQLKSMDLLALGSDCLR